MKDKFFLDTNILIYSFDNSAPKKKKIAKELIKEALLTGIGIISYQVMQEFLNVATRKFSVPLKITDAKIFLEQVLFPLCEIHSSPDLYYFALDLQEKTKYSFYDSLIVASAIKSGCSILYTEDLQTGRILGDLSIKNPF